MKALILIIFLLNFSAHTKLKRVELTVNVIPELQNLFNEGIRIQFESSDYLKDTIVINPNVIAFESLSAKTIVVRLSGEMKCLDGTKKAFYLPLRIKIERQETTKVNLTFPFDCELNKYTGGKICPRCQTTNNVIPIYFGLVDPLSLKGNIGVDYELGGCERSSCDPEWYCKRDSLTF